MRNKLIAVLILMMLWIHTNIAVDAIEISIENKSQSNVICGRQNEKGKENCNIFACCFADVFCYGYTS